ncbi:hypothetical protein Phum_PHUM157670 [Pediculus humanus corporis]|uniref:Uncharacterized protein n=1 Tax=Pediculus humanus subsp. corporis TaxID=121224 RepID=E0VFI3_PEDHC|nr:uncharacterized protein Phum_PHUM157670 [Pediculus humanus corporis]EEB12139.1 hypothetical protein Phum_PHUM157670 [Pediculus humanus corporis]
MPFIDDDLLWSPEAETKIDNLNLNQCLETTNQQQEPPELSQSDLTGLVSSLESSLSEVDVELFNQLGCSLELDTFLTDFAGVEVKEENNNDIVSDVSSTTTSNNKNILTTQQALNELRQRNAKFNIAAANPLLAEKLSSPSSIVSGSLGNNNGNYNGGHDTSASSGAHTRTHGMRPAVKGKKKL